MRTGYSVSWSQSVLSLDASNPWSGSTDVVLEFDTDDDEVVVARA
jgi:hypothetical protein